VTAGCLTAIAQPGADSSEVRSATVTTRRIALDLPHVTFSRGSRGPCP
jgi:hypothetical protein